MHDSPATPRLGDDGRQRHWSRIAVINLTIVGVMFLAMIIFLKTMAYLHQSSSGTVLPYIDFDIFHLAGRLTLAGQAVSAYSPTEFFAAEARDSGGWLGQLLPWAYPPQFDLAVAGLALLPKYLGYLLLEGGGLIGLAFVLWRLSGRAIVDILFVAAPMVVSGLVLGQNGLVTGCLIGWFVLAMLRGRRSAGIPLGLMVIKPHLALGLGLYALLRREWSVLGVALGIVVASALAATLVLTPAIWPAFLSGLSESGRMLAEDAFPHINFVSGYAALRSIGLPASYAMAGQAVEAVFAAGLIAYTVSLRLGARMELGVATVATLAFSPYAFAYDLPILAVGIALLWPLVADRIPVLWRSVLVLACYVAGAGFVVTALMMGRDANGTQMAVLDQPPAVSSFAFLVILAATAIMVRRQGRS